MLTNLQDGHESSQESTDAIAIQPWPFEGGHVSYGVIAIRLNMIEPMNQRPK